MRARITPDDIAAGQLVEPGKWYPCEIVDYNEEGASTDGSTNGYTYFKVADGKFKGARFRYMVNEKMMSKAAPLLKALGARVDPEKGIDADMSRETLVGKYVDVHIRRGESNRGNPYNEVVEFAPIGQVTKFVPPVPAVK